MIDKKATIKRVFTINYKVKDFSDINDDIDLLILGIANVRDDYGWTALMWASSYDNLEVVQELIKAGADVDIQDNKGKTALSYAKMNGNQEIIDILKKAGSK